MQTFTIRKIETRWDPKTCFLLAAVTFNDNQTICIALPLAHVVRTFEGCFADAGVRPPDAVGDLDTVEGFGSWIKGAVKSAGKVAKGAVKTATKVVNKTAGLAATVVKSKYTGYLLAATAVVVPAVGAAALAAQQSARLALNAYEDAKRAKNAVKKTATTVKAIARGANIQKSVRQLASQANRNPQARMAIAALKSMH